MPPHPLLLLPGLLCDGALWQHQRRDLADLAWMHVADMTLDDSLAAMADRAVAAMPDRFAVAGMSMGGYLAFEIMRRMPQRVSRLCLIASAAAPDSDAQSRRRRGLMALTRSNPRFIGISPRLLPDLLHTASLGDAGLARSLTEMALRVGREAYLRQQTVIVNRPDSRPGLTAIDVPTLVLVGEADRMTPPAASAAMAAAIPGAVLTVLAGCGHVPPLERPDLVSTAMRGWLRATEALPNRQAAQ